MKAIAHLWREQRLALLIFVGGAAVAIFFAARLAFFTLYWADPSHRQQTPDGWMTPGYIARSWNVPRDDLARHLHLEPGKDGRLTLAEIAQDRGVPLEVLLNEVAAFLATEAGK
ncbi:hypothetical protein OEW28_08240 [Defluviimonas sp. WL0002]|uniref:Uncharacterized protein n=1 Tax=Albidovulum marisflavi TaxID=2984159 RepID=A0ABT2ZBY8_9RHOB|nr:hypothetical protein [Defluviimonas sp. WL0002]MCV2868616.1 hypothetical protein [Defluviimonas sp. WL0002]